MLNKSYVEKILSKYNIDEEIKKIICIQEQCKDNRYVGVFEIITSKHKLICKVNDCENNSTNLIEKQSQFAMMLYRNNIVTAKKYKHNNYYCTKLKIENRFYNITLEEYIGKEVENISLDMFKKFGEILGKMHTFSVNNKFKIGKSFISSDIESGEAKFAKLLNKANPIFPNNKHIKKLTIIHDNLVKELSTFWKTLPMGAVHGDLGMYNNIIETTNGLAVIDFNMASDEVLLGDVLCTIYSTIHKASWQEKYKKYNQKDILETFLSGYMKYYSLSEIESEYYPKVAALFDGLFFVKMIIDIWNSGEKNKALQMLKSCYSHFEPLNHVLTIN